MKLDQSFLDQVSGAVHGTWGEIGSDTLQCARENKERINNTMAIQTVLDANYMSTNGFEVEEKLIDEAIKEHKYPKVEKFLASKIKLI